MNRLTFGLKLLVCFFVFDALERAYGLARAGTVGARLPHLLALSFDVLLAAQILLRTRAGRFWGIIYLCACTGLGLYLLVVEPARWLELDRLSRGKLLATYALDLAFVGVLASRRSARVLCR